MRDRGAKDLPSNRRLERRTFGTDVQRGKREREADRGTRCEVPNVQSEIRIVLVPVKQTQRAAITCSDLKREN